MYVNLLPLVAKRVLRSQGFNNFHPWLPDWQGRANFREYSPWDYTSKGEIAVGVYHEQMPYGFFNHWFLLMHRFGDDSVIEVPVLNQNALVTGTVTTTATSDITWNNVSNIVECIGGGGAGCHGSATTTGGGGGGGGAYNSITGFSFATPGTTQFHYNVGAGGLAAGTFLQNGGDSWFGPTTLSTFPTSGTGVGAHGGSSPLTNTTAAGGAGGLTTNGFPTTSPPARNGGAGGTSTSNTAGGGGGGAGGPHGVGGAATGTTTGGTADGGTVTGGAPGNPGTQFSGTEWTPSVGCGSGGGGGNASPSTGGAGGNYGGGGGGGGRTTGTGGNGAGGLVVLTWAVEAAGWRILPLTRNRNQWGHV